MTSDKGGFYYHVNYRTWPAGTEVKSFVAEDLTRLADKIKDVADRLSDPRKGGGPPAERTKTPFDVKLAADQEAVLWEMDGPKAVCGFLVHLEAADLDAAARQVVVYMSFDGDKKDEKSGQPVLEKTVESPIGDFFGTAPGLTPYDSLPLGITKDKPQDLWCHWWMPFNKKAVIKVKNLGEQEVRVSGAVAVMPWEWNDKSLLFHAKWRIEKHLPTPPDDRLGPPGLQRQRPLRRRCPAHHQPGQGLVGRGRREDLRGRRGLPQPLRHRHRGLLRLRLVLQRAVRARLPQPAALRRAGQLRQHLA